MFTRQKSQIDIKKSTQKLLDSKKEIGARIKHLKLILDTVDLEEAKCVFSTHYSHIYNLVYEGIVNSESKLRGPANQRQREELESILQILEKIMLLLPDLLQCRWQLHSLSRLFAQLLHPHNSIRLRREAIRLFILWYTALNTSASKAIDDMFKNLFRYKPPETKFKDPQDQVVVPLEITPISHERNDIDSAGEYLLECLLDFMVTESSRHLWNNSLKFNGFLFIYEKFKAIYLETVFPDFKITYDLYSDSPIELPEVRRGTSQDEVNNSLAGCQVVFIKWIANYTHSVYKTWNSTVNQKLNITNKALPGGGKETDENVIAKDIILGSRTNINIVHEVFRRALLMNFVQSAIIRRVICVYKDWIQMNVPELPIFMNEPEPISNNSSPSGSSGASGNNKESNECKVGAQKIFRLFFCNSSAVFLLFDVPSDSLLEEQVDICKRVLNIYRFAVMNARMDAQTWEQLLVVMLNVTSKVLDPKENNVLGTKLSSALFQTLIVSWVKASLNVKISTKLWDELQSVLSLLAFNDNLITEWAKTMETLTRVLSRHVYNLDLSSLPLDRLTEQKTKRNRGGKKQSEDNTITVHPGDLISNAASHQSQNSNNLTKHHDDVTMTMMPTREKSLKIKLKRSLSEGNLAGSPGKPAPSSALLTSGGNASGTGGGPSDLKRARSVDMEIYNSSTDISSIVSFENNHNNLIDASLPDHHQNIRGEEQMIQIPTSASMERLGHGVIEGGDVKGWLPNVAAILWRRMLGILGDVNLIPYADTHSHFFHVLVDIWATLIKIRRNLGVSLDNLSTPIPPELTPPLQIIAPWCFQVFELPREFKASKYIAISLLCDITYEDVILGQDYITKFYSTLHRIIVSSTTTQQQQDLQNELIRKLGLKLIGKMIPGFTLLLFELVQVSNSILSSAVLSKTPRMEAATLLGNILFVSKFTSDLPVLNPAQIKFTPVSSSRTQEITLMSLLNHSKTEPTSSGRAITLQALTMYAVGLLHQMRMSQSFSSMDNSTAPNYSTSAQFSESQRNQIETIINILIASANVENKTICLVASDLLLCLSDYASEIHAHFESLRNSIILGLKTSIVNAMDCSGGRPFEKRLLLALILCLGEWCMTLQLKSIFSRSCPEYQLLSSVFDALLQVIRGKPISKKTFVGNVKDFNTSVPFDDIQKQDPSSGRSLGKESIFLRPDKNSKSPGGNGNGSEVETVQLAATMLLYHLETQLGHFPINASSAHCGSVISENHDSIYEADELNSIIFTLPNLQLFTLDNNRILTVIELDNEDGDIIGDGGESYVRFILRDLSGKFCWDISSTQLYQSDAVQPEWHHDHNQYSEVQPRIPPTEDNMVSTTRSLNPVTVGPRLTLRKRQSGILPSVKDSAHDLDNLDDLLSYIEHTSPECTFNTSVNNNSSTNNFGCGLEESEDDVVSLLVSQRNTEIHHVNTTPFPVILESDDQYKRYQNNNFRNSRRLLSHLGYNAWDKRSSIHLLHRDEKLLRELKNLDTQRCRETHKIAVIYVAEGQEDKLSILSNTGGSEDYEDFVSGLGWEVDLESHAGFMGGLCRNKTSGETAPYFTTSFTEVIFHVSTRMPSETQDHLLQKTRHLGNDEVHIVWTEHNRDYRRDIIPTEFCDVLIVIYPLQFGLYRVSINRKPDVPYFGPLYNECVVEKSILPHLVRCTAINASRTKRSSLPYFKNYFEERSEAIKTIMANHQVRTTFEHFTSSLYRPLNPSPNYQQFQSGSCSRASATSFSSTHTNKTINSNSNQVAALIDRNITSVHGESTSSQRSHQDTLSVPASPVPTPTPPIPPKRLSMKLAHGPKAKPKIQTPPVSPSIARR